MTEKAFIAGATGYTGQNVVRVLAERKIAAVAHVRPDSASLDQWRKKFQSPGAEVDTTPWEESALTETFARLKAAIIFALLGTTRERMKAVAAHGQDPKSADYEAVDYGLTAMLIRAATAANISPRFVYLSAIGVKPGAASPYYQARYKAETELRDSGLPYTIARPSFISGPDREGRPTERLASSALDGVLSFAGALGAKKLRDRYLSLTGRELAGILVRLALDPDAENQVFETDGLRQYLD